MMRDQSRSGFVSLLGVTNAGKSTFFNALVGEQLAAVTSKEQTTWNRICGILTHLRGHEHAKLPAYLKNSDLPSFQVIFHDTPGFHDRKDELNKRMIAVSEDVLLKNDLHLWFVDGSDKNFLEDNLAYLKVIKRSQKPIFLVVTKLDLIKDELSAKIKVETLREEFGIDRVFGVSSVDQTGFEPLLKAIVEELPEGPFYYPESHLTDQSERFFVTEIIREQIFQQMREEIPYETAVSIIDYKDEKEIVKIHAEISPEKESQKRMLIGSGGRQIRELGMAARKRLEKFLGKKVFLEVHAKTRPGWRKNHYFLKQMGLDKPSRFQSAVRR